MLCPQGLAAAYGCRFPTAPSWTTRLYNVQIINTLDFTVRSVAFLLVYIIGTCLSRQYPGLGLDYLHFGTRFPIMVAKRDYGLS